MSKYLLMKIVAFWVQLRDTYLYLFRHATIVNGYVDDHTWQGIRHRNWGDDLNYYFLRQLTGRPVVMYHNFKFAKWLHLKNYLCIGTLLDAVNYANAQTVVWGSGVSGQERTFVHPNNILAVRGPKTKEFCDRYGVDCPEVYGDPALLLPLVYNPRERFKVQGSRFKVPSGHEKCNFPLEREKEVNELTRAKHNYTHESAVSPLAHKYALGIIPHVVDQQHPVIQVIKEKYADEILVIDLAHYEKWTDVIDQISSCERILSSSLHGLIVSDAYQIPNCWIELTGRISGGHFKYYDYASSVERSFEKPIKVESFADVRDMLDHIDDVFSKAEAEIIKALQQGLIRVTPFQIKLSNKVETDN